MFPLIKLAKKLKAKKRQNWLETANEFPLIKLAKKLKEGVRIQYGKLKLFPLIKLAKKLKERRQKTAELAEHRFPLIKLAKKLKVAWVKGRRFISARVSIN